MVGTKKTSLTMKRIRSEIELNKKCAFHTKEEVAANK